ncbi:MAG: hypothetical protein M3Y18_05495, partial [Candidatus Eremiobacteraeota bacterium]|nr:hypothetical protein [Candidatus Eremiobacteraeota bacterium]
MTARAVLFLALLFALASPAIAQRAPSVVLRDDGNVGITGAQFVIAAGLDRQTPEQSGIAALVAECVLRTPVSGVPLRAAIAQAGGSIDYVVEAHDVRFYLEGLASGYGRLLPLFRAALERPDFRSTTVDAARETLIAQSAQAQRIALTVGIEMLDRDFYTSSNAGLPQFGISPTLIAVAPTNARVFFEKTYRRNGSFASAAGNLRFVNEAQIAAVLDALPAGGSLPVPVARPSLKGDTKQLIAHRDIPVPWLIARDANNP